VCHRRAERKTPMHGLGPAVRTHVGGRLPGRCMWGRGPGRKEMLKLELVARSDYHFPTKVWEGVADFLSEVERLCREDRDPPAKCIELAMRVDKERTVSYTCYLYPSP